MKLRAAALGTAATGALLLAACGVTEPRPSARVRGTHRAKQPSCQLCQSLPVGRHASFVIGELAVPGACSGDISCPPPVPATIIKRAVRITQHGDVELSGVLDAKNPTSTRTELVLDATADAGTRRWQASVHGFPQETIAYVPAHGTSAVAYQFVFPSVTADQYMFEVKASASSNGLTAGSISLVVQTLS
jgi:hypothetical protein